MSKIEGYACHGVGQKLVPFTYEPRHLGPNDIEIAITHCGICGSDVHTLDSGWGPTTYPVIVGHEIVGTVSKKGENVPYKIGDRVGVGAQCWACLEKDCYECSCGFDQCCDNSVFTYNAKYQDGGVAYGGYAKAVRVDYHYAFIIPNAIPSDLAAPLLCAGVTTFRPLKYHGCGEQTVVGVVGIGGLGHLGLQWARALGAKKVIAISHSDKKRKDAMELGATNYVIFNQESKPDNSVRHSIDLLLITSNAKDIDWPKLNNLLKTNGKVILVGLPEENLVIPPFFLVRRNISLVGSVIGARQDVEDMLALAAAKNVRPVIERLPMKDCNAGVEKVRNGDVRFRVVLANE